MSEDTLISIAAVMRGLTAFILFLFIYRFIRFRREEYGVYMILLPNIAYIIYSVMDFYSRDSTHQIHLMIFKAPVVHFSMYWSAAFGFFTYYVLKMPRPPTFVKRFILIFLLGCLLLAIIFGVV